MSSIVLYAALILGWVAAFLLWRKKQIKLPNVEATDSTRTKDKPVEFNLGKTGYTLYRFKNIIGGHVYYSDEVGGGVFVWDTCLVDRNTLFEALRLERMRYNNEKYGRETGTKDDSDLLQEMGSDPVKWAEEFGKRAIHLGYAPMDEGWLISWFANAMAVASDRAKKDFL